MHPPFIHSGTLEFCPPASFLELTRLACQDVWKRLTLSESRVRERQEKQDARRGAHPHQAGASELYSPSQSTFTHHRWSWAGKKSTEMKPKGKKKKKEKKLKPLQLLAPRRGLEDPPSPTAQDPRMSPESAVLVWKRYSAFRVLEVLEWARAPVAPVSASAASPLISAFLACSPPSPFTQRERNATALWLTHFQFPPLLPLPFYSDFLPNDQSGGFLLRSPLMRPHLWCASESANRTFKCRWKTGKWLTWTSICLNSFNPPN